MPKAKNTAPVEAQNEADKTAVAESDTLKIQLEKAKATAPVLVVISGKPLGKSFFLTKESIILGRDLAADISIGETSISRKHTEFLISSNGLLVKDLGSTNGTYVNDTKVESNSTLPLEDGDLVRCGNTILKFLKEGQIENLFQQKIYDMAHTDDLTQAHNKKAILDLLKDEFSRSQIKMVPLTLIMFDLDHFKQINDKYGHMAGDYVLKETCALIKNKMIRQKDALGRYGGEEFALVLRETPLQIAVDVAERIRSTIEKHPYQFDGKAIHVTISLGISTLDSTAKSSEDLLATADKALYDAKHQGRNRSCIR